MKYNIKVIIIILLIIPFLGCRSYRIKNDVLKVVGKHMVFPQTWELYHNGESQQIILPNSPMIVITSGMSDCNICDIMKLKEWYNMFSNCNILFIAYTVIDKKIRSAAMADRNDVYVMLTEDPLFENELKQLHPINVFLIDGNGEILLVGDPIGNPQLLELYRRTIINLNANNGIL